MPPARQAPWCLSRRRHFNLNANRWHSVYNAALATGGPTLMTTHTLSSPAISVAPHSSPVGRGQSLHEAAKGQVYTVRQVVADPHAPERARQLEEIGFCPGERVMI